MRIEPFGFAKESVPMRFLSLRLCRDIQHCTLETVACRQALPALLLFRGKDLPCKSLHRAVHSLHS
jgi:hypothetical protein